MESDRHQTGGRAAESALPAALGWFSLALGAAELAAPARGAASVGAPRHERVVRAAGAREVLSGLGILSGRHQAAWLWSRVGGDAMDLALLAAAAASPKAKLGRLAAAAAAVGSVAAFDIVAGLRAGNPLQAARGPLRLRAAVLINRPSADLYRFWRALENLPRFMRHIRSVRQFSEIRSRWTAQAPLGREIEWDAEITQDAPGRCIAWRTVDGACIPHRGAVRFESRGERGTLVEMELEAEVPAAAAPLTGRYPEHRIAEDLRLFQQLMETGETATTAGQPAGRGSAMVWYDQP